MSQGESSSPLKLVVFDVDGTIADTERHGHRVGFNLAFEDAGLPYRWEVEEYAGLLETPGGEQRLDGFLQAEGHDRAEAAALAKTLHARKQEVFRSLVADARVPLRPGVARLIDDLSAEGIRLAVATTGGRVWVLELLDSLLGPERSARFEAVVTGEDVAIRKPDPEVYRIVLERLGCSPREAIAVEDATVGVRAAVGAGMTCLVARNEFTLHHDFSGASLVLESLGAPGAPAVVVDNPFGIQVEPEVGTATLRRLLAAATAR